MSNMLFITFTPVNDDVTEDTPNAWHVVVPTGTTLDRARHMARVPSGVKVRHRIVRNSLTHG